MSQPTLAQLGAAIRALRVSRELSAEDLAAKANIHWTSVSRIERGVQNVSWTTIMVLGTALEVELVDLINSASTFDPTQ